ncbi:MAG: hypothetical protein PHX40_01900 [Bacilli bacterium]|nr:hypothetical protein [Bacilli bacterium]
MKELTIDNSVNEYFKNDDIIHDVLSDVLPYYQDLNISDQVSNLTFKPAEIVMGDMYQAKFGREDNDSMYKIKRQKSDYFKQKLLPLYNDTYEADLKIILNDIDKPVYIRFVDENSGTNSFNIKKNPDVEYELYSRYNEYGEKLYDLIDYKNMRIKSEGDQEVIEFKIGYKPDNKNELILNDKFLNKINKLLQSFNNIKAIIPLNNGKIIEGKTKDGTLINIYKSIGDIFSSFNQISLSDLDVTKQD